MKNFVSLLMILGLASCARSAVTESKDLICPGNKLVTVSPMGSSSVNLTYNDQTISLSEQAIDKGKKFSGAGYRLYLIENKYYLAFPGTKKARFCRD